MVIRDSEVEGPQDLGDDQPHLKMAEAIECQCLSNQLLLFTYLRPRQPRLPNEKGWLASLLSCHSGSNHRSGIYS